MAGDVARRFQLMLDLVEAGEAMLRQKLRRQHPELSAADIEAKVVEWRSRRPGAEQGDGMGRPVSWPRNA